MRTDDDLGPLVGLAASRHNAFHTNEAAEIGITTRRLARCRDIGLLESLYPKVWAIKSVPPTASQTLRAATLTTKGAAGLRSAAWLHGWIDRAPTPPHVWIPPSIRRPTDKPVRVHQVGLVCRQRDIEVVDYIPTLNKAATLCLLGAEAPRLVVEKCLDEFLRTSSERWLDATLERLWSRTTKGPSILNDIRNAPARLAGVPDSWLERVCAKLVNLPWLPPISLQHEVEVKGRKLRLDVACEELKLGIEVHSRSFHFGPGATDADNVRDIGFAGLGWELIYVTYSQLLDPQNFVDEFATAARARAELLGIHLPLP